MESLAAIQEEDEEMKFDHAAALSDELMEGISPAKSMVNTTITSNAEESKQAASRPPMNAQMYQHLEDDFDAEFFGRKVPKVKLNKGEKRQLKFAMKSGVDVNQIEDLKSFLGEQMKQSKMTHNTPHVAAGQETQKKKFKQKTSTYKDLEDYTSD